MNGPDEEELEAEGAPGVETEDELDEEYWRELDDFTADDHHFGWGSD